MARALSVVVLCLCLAAVFAADLRKLQAERAAAVAPPATGTGVSGKNAGDLDSANSWGWGGWGPGFYGGPWGWGPWGYGYGWGYGYPYGWW